MGRPMLLIFGSHSCGVFRATAPWLNRMFDRFGERADLAAIYVAEAHPESEPQKPRNIASQISIPQARTLAERALAAQNWIDKLGLRMPVLLDGMDDRARILFDVFQIRIYLIDSQGRLRYRTPKQTDGFRSQLKIVRFRLQGLLDEAPA